MYVCRCGEKNISFIHLSWVASTSKPIVNKTAMNRGVCINVWVSVFTSFGYISRNRVAESYSNSVFTFLRNQTCVFWIHTFSKYFFDSSCVPSSHTEVGNELWWHRHCLQVLQSNVWVIFCSFFFDGVDDFQLTHWLSPGLLELVTYLYNV